MPKIVLKKSEPMRLTKNKNRQSQNPLDAIDYTGNVAVDTAAECEGVVNEFKARAKQERKRMEEATDSEYYVCMCFQTRAEKEDFLQKTGLIQHGDKYIDGKHLADAMGIKLDLSDRKVKPLKDFSKRFPGTIREVK